MQQQNTGGQPPTLRGLSLRVPSFSRGMSATTSQFRASEAALEPTPESRSPEYEREPEPDPDIVTEEQVEEWTPSEPTDGVPHTENVNEVSLGDLEMGYEQEQPRQKGKARGFVGGFVSGLRNLPRIMYRNPLGGERKALKKGAPAGYDQGDTDTLPRYDDPGHPIPGPSNLQYVERVEMPSEQHASAGLSYQDIPEEHLTDVPMENPHDTHLPEPSREVLSSPPPVGTPVLVEPQPTADYVKMESPVRLAPLDDSFSAHFARIHNFFTELKKLPWMSSRVTVDYYPAASYRARIPKTNPGSWYTTSEHVEVDLLATPAPVKAQMHHPDEQPSHARMRPPSVAESSCHSGSRRFTPSISSHGALSPRLSQNGRWRPSSGFTFNGAHTVHLGAHLPSPNMQPGFAVPLDPETRQPVHSYSIHSSFPQYVPGISPPPVSHPPTHVAYSDVSSPPPLSNVPDISLAPSH